MNDGNMKAERDSVSVFVSLAEEFFKNNAYEQAISYCIMALNQIPDMKEAEILLYKSYKMINNQEQAQDLLLKMLEKYPDDNEIKALSEEKETPANVIEQIEEEYTGEKDTLPADETENLLDKALYEINKIKGVLGSIIIEESGLIIKERTVKGIDAEIASALFSTIFNVADDSVEKLEIGEITRIFIEIGKIRIYLFKGNGYIIGIFTEEIVKIGLIHVRAKQLLQDIKKVLGV